MSKAFRRALSVTLSIFILLVTIFVSFGENVQASDNGRYLDEYISHFNNLNNGSVSYSMDSDGRYRIDKKDDSEFKVLQLTDIHLTGYDKNGGWASVQNLWEHEKNLTNCDRQEILAVYRIIEKTRPDLIILTGDSIYGGDFNTISGNKRALDALIRMMNRINVPWIYLMGNHDHHFADGYMGENCRDYLYSKLRQANSLLFYDRYKPFYASDSGDFTGTPEYMYGSYKLYNKDGSFNSVIIGLDSGSNDIYNDNYDYIYDAQCDWYEKEIRSIAAENGLAPSKMNSYLYFHIPLNISIDAATNGSASSYNYGELDVDGGCSKHSDPIWNRAVALGSTRTMSYGHDHANDLWMTYNGIDLIFGKSIEYSVCDWDVDFPERKGSQRGGTEIHIRQNKSYYVAENSLNDFYKNSFVLEDDGTWRWENGSNTVDYGYTGWGWTGYDEEYMQNGILLNPETSGNELQATKYTGIIHTSDGDYCYSSGNGIRIPDGIEAVYNKQFYIENYPDVAEAFHGDDTLTLYHFLACGMKEGRIANPGFDPEYYRSKNSDLNEAFGSDLSQYYYHFLKYGINEKRNTSPVFDLQYYRSHYSDLNNAFGSDNVKYYDQFARYGMSEGRNASEGFDVYAYMNNYSDLRSAFGDKLAKYYSHYLKFGRREGRIADQQLTNVWKGVDYSSVFDPDYYAAKRPDVVAAYGSSRRALIEHFVECGMKEGTQAIEIFDTSYYKENYSDLSQAFGNDNRQYYYHFMNHGIYEGRNGSADFSPHVYRSNYRDLDEQFGDDWGKYYFHYLKYGKAEGRDGRNQLTKS